MQLDSYEVAAVCAYYWFFFFREKTAYENEDGLVGEEIGIRDRFPTGRFPPGGGGTVRTRLPVLPAEARAAQHLTLIHI